MAINTASARIQHHSLTTPASIFTVPPSEDFTDGSWTIEDLAIGEIGINLADDRIFFRTTNGIVEMETSSFTALWTRSGDDIQALEDILSTPVVYPNILAPLTGVSDLGSNAIKWKDIYAETLQNGTGLIEVDPTTISIQNDGGAFSAEGLFITTGYAAIWALAQTKIIELGTTSIAIIDETASGFVEVRGTSVQARTKQPAVDIPGEIFAEIFTADNSAAPVLSNSGEDNNSVFIGSRDSSMDTGVTNSVIIGGVALTGDTDDTVFMPRTNVRGAGVAGYAGSETIRDQAVVQTADATVTTIYTIPMTNGDMISVQARVNGQDSAAVEACGSNLFAVFTKQGGTCVQLGSTDTSMKSTTLSTVIIDTDATDVRVRVTGIAATTMNWVATVDYHKTITNV